MERPGTRPLLRSIMPEGTVYLFVLEMDDTWTIRRNGEVIETGRCDGDGIDNGTRHFCELSKTESNRRTFADANSG